MFGIHPSGWGYTHYKVVWDASVSQTALSPALHNAFYPKPLRFGYNCRNLRYFCTMAKKKKREYEIEIVNRRATFEYHFIELFEAGIVLTGTEIKSVRKSQVSLKDAYCVFQGGELYVRNLYIKEYENATHFNHEPRRMRKLLLKRAELKKLHRRVKERGLTIVPYRMYVNERGLAKLEIALAQGKKVHDKRESLREKDQKRELERMKKWK